MARQPQQLPESNRSLAETVRESKSPAISRAAAILRLLGKSETPLRLQAIAQALGLVPSTCLYVLRALVEEDLVAFDPDTKRYSLEVGVLTLAGHWLRRNQFSDLVQPELERLCRDYGVTMLGVQILGLDNIVVVAVSQSWNNFQLSAQVGSRFPALISATGRCIAAFGEYDFEELQPRFTSLRWDNPPEFEEWKAQVLKARKQGIAIDEGNYIAGVTVLATPVRDASGKLSHAIVALGMESALRDTLENLQHSLIGAAGQLSSQLGGS